MSKGIRLTIQETVDSVYEISEEQYEKLEKQWGEGLEDISDDEIAEIFTEDGTFVRKVVNYRDNPISWGEPCEYQPEESEDVDTK